MAGLLFRKGIFHFQHPVRGVSTRYPFTDIKTNRKLSAPSAAHQPQHCFHARKNNINGHKTKNQSSHKDIKSKTANHNNKQWQSSHVIAANPSIQRQRPAAIVVIGSNPSIPPRRLHGANQTCGGELSRRTWVMASLFKCVGWGVKVTWCMLG